jgi:DNA-binding transcriptional ArsR family regulator
MTMTSFGAVADPARRALLDALLGGPKTVGALSDATGLSQPNTSRHLRILRETGMVSRTPDGQRRLYVLRPDRLLEIERWLTPYLELWNSSLDTLERHLDEGS